MLLFLLADVARACSVCQGNPDSELVKGAQGGVVVMILVTYGVLLCFGAMVALWLVRARRLSRVGAVRISDKTEPDGTPSRITDE